MSEDRKELIKFVRDRVSKLPEGNFKRRMETRVKLLENSGIPSEAWYGLAIVVLACLGVWAYAKLAGWTRRGLLATMI